MIRQRPHREYDVGGRLDRANVNAGQRRVDVGSVTVRLRRGGGVGGPPRTPRGDAGGRSDAERGGCCIAPSGMKPMALADVVLPRAS
ncbi:hypothetical protein ABZT02_36655 [Streptomyces sp. NPDC005402]|uniref:hypothetical protein n=1 Tax=Streptomyces sp. NPDC005402 TaxID=3155338 RepID=UPI0033A955EA